MNGDFKDEDVLNYHVTCTVILQNLCKINMD